VWRPRCAPSSTGAARGNFAAAALGSAVIGNECDKAGQRVRLTTECRVLQGVRGGEADTHISHAPVATGALSRVCRSSVRVCCDECCTGPCEVI
jgi:hypothetical protein